jgi:hypothetical protein
MCKSEKRHNINVAYDAISKVRDDTDEDKWAFEFLTEALMSLRDWFEESEEDI